GAKGETFPPSARRAFLRSCRPRHHIHSAPQNRAPSATSIPAVASDRTHRRQPNGRSLISPRTCRATLGLPPCCAAGVFETPSPVPLPIGRRHSDRTIGAACSSKMTKQGWHSQRHGTKTARFGQFWRVVGDESGEVRARC